MELKCSQLGHQTTTFFYSDIWQSEANQEIVKNSSKAAREIKENKLKDVDKDIIKISVHSSITSLLLHYLHILITSTVSTVEFDILPREGKETMYFSH